MVTARGTNWSINVYFFIAVRCEFSFLAFGNWRYEYYGYNNGIFDPSQPKKVCAKFGFSTIQVESNNGKIVGYICLVEEFYTIRSFDILPEHSLSLQNLSWPFILSLSAVHLSILEPPRTLQLKNKTNNKKNRTNKWKCCRITFSLSLGQKRIMLHKLERQVLRIDLFLS